MNSEEQFIPISPTPDISFFHRAGGESFFVELIERFYKLVEDDPVLRPLYPVDLEPGKAHLASFLSQYWGGPPRYSAERGHPRLRRRHAIFPIGQTERDAWVRHMTTAVRSMGLEREDEAMLVSYFENTATFLQNQP